MPFDVTCRTTGSHDYPERLRDLPCPPKSLYSIGSLGTLSGSTVAIVGTRLATPYGLRMTRALCLAFARADICVISGLARGIDAEAHRTMLGSAGRTAAVLGTGIDVAYPAAHRELHAAVGAQGLLLSENPPGAHAHQGAFPRRNRIIAALAPVTIVIEAGPRSGALNTATHALNLGRVVAAVPGPIDSPQSEGTNLLLRDGAAVIASVADALALVGASPTPPSAPIQLNDSDERVWSALHPGALMIDDLVVKSRLPASECMVAITSLELMGLVECLLTGEVRRR